MIVKRYLSIIFNFIFFVLILLGIIYIIGINKIEQINGETFFTAIVTIFVFGVGLFAKIIEDKIQQNKKDIQLKKIFIVNLKTISYGLRIQIGNCKEVIKTLESTNPENIMFSSYTELDYFEINNLASEDLYRIFIDNIKGNENKNISTLEDLRKQLRFIENSKDNFIKSFENLYKLFIGYADETIKGMKKLGAFFDKEATILLSNNIDIEEDKWFFNFSKVLYLVQPTLKTSDNSFTDYEKLEREIIPEFLKFEQSQMKDLRTPIVTSIFNEIITPIFQRKDALKSLVNLLKFYRDKYSVAHEIFV